MAKSGKKWSKEEFESTFDAFIKAPLSSGDDETEKIKQLLRKPVNSKKVSQSDLWWADDSDDDSMKKKKPGKSFLKNKASTQSTVKSKVTKNSSSITSQQKSSTNSKPNTPPRKAAARKDKSKTSSKYENSNKLRNSKGKIESSLSKDSLEDISEKSEEHEINEHRRHKTNPMVPIQDSSIETSASYEGVQSSTSIPNLDLNETTQSKTNPGFDTLDEQMEKQNFFNNLENGADHTVDYGKLNQELSHTGTALGVGKTSDSHAPETELQFAGVDTSTPIRNQGTDSGDAEQKPSMLSKVALDSMESPLNTTSPKVGSLTHDNLAGTLPDTLKTQALSGQMGTNTSRDLEALHQAYRDVEMSPTLFGGGDASRPTTAKALLEPSIREDYFEKKEVDRSVGDILREMEAIDKRGREIEREDDKIQLRSDYRSPRSPQHNLHLRHHDDVYSDYTHTENTEIYRPITSVANTQSKKTVKERKDIKPHKEISSQSLPQEDIPRSARDRFAHVQSSGYGKATSPTARGTRSRSRSAGKSPPSKAQSLSNIHSPSRPMKPKRSESSPGVHLKRSTSPQLTSDADVTESIDSYQKYSTTRVVQQRPNRDRELALMAEVKDLREQWNATRAQHLRLQDKMSMVDAEHKKEIDSIKVKYEDEIFTLKQENFVLASKLKEVESAKNKKSETETSTAEQDKTVIERLEKEIREQEDLLAGYQAENKKLYEEIKSSERQTKATEGSMFRENQRLTAELANVRQELDLKMNELKNKGIITSVAAQQQIAVGNAEAAAGANRIARLEGELAEAKRVQDRQHGEISHLQQNKFELEKHVESIIKEKEDVLMQLAECLKPDQVKDLERNYREEKDKLQKKLKWYAENQELLDKSNIKIRAKDEEIHKLKLRLEDFKSEAGMKLEENKIRAKEKAADAKKIQDLERQIKEMEQVIRRRHPNSLPAMMMVAATVPDAVAESVPAAKGRSIQTLESRIKKLEKELEGKDETAQQDLRAMEQKYNHVKLQFEERIADLEQQLSLYSGKPFSELTLKEHPHSHALALERELERVRERSKTQISDLQADVNRLTTQLTKLKKNQDNFTRNEIRETESEWKQQLEKLHAQLRDKDNNIQLLHATVEKMRIQNTQQNVNRKVGKRTGDKSWPNHPHAPIQNKNYEPGNFVDDETAVVLQENQELKIQIETLQLELDQQRVDLRRSLAQTESEARQNNERLENQIEVMRSSHQQEVQRLLAEQAFHSSSSKVVELQSKCDTQEMMINHLQSQLKKAVRETEYIPLLKSNESKLEAKIVDLQNKLKEARSTQRPEMRHYESLEEKLSDLVERQRQREATLDSVVKQSPVLGRAELESELEKWKKLVETKNKQLTVFRSELDSILEVLKTLQRQGITLPVSTSYS